MALIDEYKRQWAWRSWGPILDSLPPLEGRTVLDLGCAVGDQAAELAARGAHVVGIDADKGLLSAAQSRGIVGAEFHCADLCALPEMHVPADGIWCSFATAYFPDLAAVLASWTGALRAGGWIALTEIDDLFGHAPLSERTQALLDAFAEDALRAGRYDMRMGRKLAGHLERAGLVTSKISPSMTQSYRSTGPPRPPSSMPGAPDSTGCRDSRSIVPRSSRGSVTSFSPVCRERITNPSQRSIAVWPPGLAVDASCCSTNRSSPGLVHLGGGAA
jgi:hypothetical protein